MNLTSPKNWKTVKLGEITSKMFSGGTPSTKNDGYYGGDIPWLRTQEVNFNYIYDTDIKITKEGFEGSSAKWVPADSVIVAMYGNSAGRVAYSTIPLTTNQACCNIVVDPEKADSKFLYFALLKDYVKLENMATGGAQQNLSVGVLKDYEIQIPESVADQREIAAILGSLDDKIELLRRENKTLESIAQALFREWFVEFRFPGYEGVKVDGGVPEGWKVGTVMDVIDRLSISYKCDKDDLDPQGKTPIIDQGATGLYGYTKRDPDMHASTENPVIVFTNHTCNLWLINYPFCAIQNVIPFRGKDGYDEYFVYFMTKGQVNFIEYKGHWPDFEIKEYIIPSVEIAKQFSEKVKPLIHKIWNNDSEIKTLSRLRDDLLNKIFNI